MPTYEYECTQCHKRTEAVQKFSDAPLTVCPECGGQLRKVFSAVGIVFKGSGFYKNDSRGASSTATPSASSPTTPSDASSSTPAPSTAPSATTTPSTPTPSSD